MEHAVEEFGMGAAAIAAAAALSLSLSVAMHYEQMLKVLSIKMQQNPVVVETFYE